VIELVFFTICDCGRRLEQLIWHGEDPAEVDQLAEFQQQLVLPRFQCPCGEERLADRYVFRAGSRELATGPVTRFEREEEEP